MKGTQPNRQSDLALVGTVPVELDGLWLLPTRHEERGDLQLNALRIGAGRSLWYASLAELPASASDDWSHDLRASSLSRPSTVGNNVWMRSLTGETDSLHVRARRDSETSLIWTLVDRTGVRERGVVGIERAREIADLFVTESALVFVSVVVADDGPRYQLGVAQRRERARVQWLNAGQAGWPELLHAREHTGLLQVELAVRDERADSAARVVRWTVDMRASLGAVQTLLDFAVAWPSVMAVHGEARAFLCGVSAGYLDGELSRVLVKLDLRSGNLETRSFGFARELGAPALARGRAQNGEKPRIFLLLPVYDAVRDRTDCYALDAHSLEAEPEAIIRLPPVRCAQRTYWVESTHFSAVLDSALSKIVQAVR